LSDRIPVEAYIGHVDVELGQDTILDLTDSILLNPGNYATYQWSNGSTDSSLLMSGSALGMGVYPVHLTVADSLGCLGKDTIIVVFAPLVGLDFTEADNFNLFPNPVNQSESFFLELPEGSWNVELFDLTGRILWSQRILMNNSEPYLMKIPEISPGNYHIVGTHLSGGRVSKRIQVR
ncbi:MAG: T9SS type A sorting domain-containing protein, partial [Bacteroidetes bacterium]|nr:T9SS type A sorting domain-containing protein [Bacteroidota bacterium]